MKKSTRKTTLLTLLSILGATGVFAMNLTRGTRHEAEIPPLPPVAALKHFTFGYNETLSDIYWIRLIQDFGYCGQKPSGNSFNPQGRRIGKNRTPDCNKGWSYHMLKFIISITPRNYMPQAVGPMSLSVVTDDIEGATELYQVAIQNFPEDWNVYFQAGYHYMMELEDKSQAAEYFQKARIYGGPEYLPILIARLQSDLGNEEIAEFILKQYLRRAGNDEKIRLRAEKKLEEVQKKMRGE